MQFVEIKFEVDVRMFFTIKLQINYVAFHCTKTTKKLIKKRIQRNSFNFFKSMNDLFYVLKINFDRINEKKSTILEFEDFFTKQRADEFFFIFVIRLNVIMNTITFNDIVKIFELRERMNYRLKQLIINIQKFDDYFKYINRIINIDNNNTKFQHFIKRNYDNKKFKIKQKNI